MKGRGGVLAAVLGLISLPVLLALVEAGSFYVANRSNGRLVSSGETRDYLLYVPRSYDPGKPTPLVISLHGGGMWGASQKETSQWNTVADRHGFIVVYPSGARGSGPRAWRVTSERGRSKDVRFISELIDTVEAAYNIDPTRIYANGLSNGGEMSFVLSCALSDRIAAVGMVAAAHMLPWSWCTDPRAVPMISFHGTADRQVPYRGGTSWAYNGVFPNVPIWTESWARRNRCSLDAIDSAVAADVTRRLYTSCADDADVVLYTIRDGGHTWPSGKPLPEWWVGPTSRGVDASDQMWTFFREHRLRTAQTAAAEGLGLDG